MPTISALREYSASPLSHLPQTETARAHACTILLIEDSPSQARLFQMLLERAGYRVSIAADGALGWRHACDTRPDLILLDIGLPTLDGFQVLDLLKGGRDTAGIPVIMLTQRDHVCDVMRAIEIGADDYLPKEDALTHLCTAVAQILYYKVGVPLRQ